MTRRRLDGEHVVLTRAKTQVDAMRAAFEREGADVTLWPLIEITEPEDPGPLQQAITERDRFDWIVFTSANAVASFFTSGDVPPLTARVASIGPATSAELVKRGVPVEVEATVRTGIGLAQSLESAIDRRSRLLVPRADDARPELVEHLSATGATVVPVVAYRKGLPQSSIENAAELLRGQLGWVTFTSPRIVRAFDRLVKRWASPSLRYRALSIGPTTSAELRRLKIPAIEAEQPTPAALVEAILAFRSP